MASPNIKDLLTSFSPALDFFAISSGDGRIKIWDTLKGQVQTEYADIATIDGADFFTKPDRGHLSLDYTCMKWLSLENKKKRKPGCSLLALGTGNGDVLALDVSAGQLRWRASDCHPGGVTAISISGHGSCIYTAGVDGMVCQIDSTTGSLLGKFRSSTKVTSSIAISSDGKILATAAGQLKIFNCADNKKIQKFSGHPVTVRCMVFTEDGKYILSSAVGERYIALWKIDDSKKQSASCVLSMEHPAVFLDSKGTEYGDMDNAGLYVLAISELGLCYFWYGKNIEGLRNSKPSKISLSFGAPFSKNQRGMIPVIFAAKIQGIVKPAFGQVFVASGSVVKPSFEKLIVEHGTDVNLNSSHSGVLLPSGQSYKSQESQLIKHKVTALDRANAEDAIFPIPKLYDFNEKKRRRDMQHYGLHLEEVMADGMDNSKRETKPTGDNDDQEKIEENTAAKICVEDRLRSFGILGNEDLNRESYPMMTIDITPNSPMFKDVDSLVEANIPVYKIRATILSMSPSDAFKLLTGLMTMWKSRSGSGNYVLPWISCILMHHSGYVLSQERSTQILDTLYEMAKTKCAAFQPLLQLSGRLQLIMAQVDKAGQRMIQALPNDRQVDESEDEDEYVEEVVYGEEEDDSESGMDDDDN